MTEMDDTRALALELYQTLENLGASAELLGVIGSCANGEDDAICLLRHGAGKTVTQKGLLRRTA